MILELKGIPNPKQAEFFRSTARHTAYGGARGGGKSWAMRRKLVLLALNYPGLNVLIMRRTLPELRENHVIPLLKELKGAAKYNAAERVFKFPNGSRLRLGYCDSASDVYQYQGQEYEVIGLEEATHFTEEQMQFLTTCNRTVRRATGSYPQGYTITRLSSPPTRSISGSLKTCRRSCAGLTWTGIGTCWRGSFSGNSPGQSTL